MVKDWGKKNQSILQKDYKETVVPVQNRNLTPGNTYCCYLKSPPGSVCFLDDTCCDFYLRRLLARSACFRVQLHAYSLLTDEAMLLLTPLTPFSVNDWLCSVNHCFGEYFKQRYRRPAPIYPMLRAVTLIRSDAAVLDCQKFLELEAARILKLEHPGEHHWSSYSCHAFGNGRSADLEVKQVGLSPHRATRRYQLPGTNGLHDYREFIARGFSESYHRYLSVRLRHGKPIGVSRKRFPVVV